MFYRENVHARIQPGPSDLLHEVFTFGFHLSCLQPLKLPALGVKRALLYALQLQCELGAQLLCDGEGVEHDMVMQASIIIAV